MNNTKNTSQISPLTRIDEQMVWNMNDQQTQSPTNHSEGSLPAQVRVVHQLPSAFSPFLAIIMAFVSGIQHQPEQQHGVDQNERQQSERQ